MESFAIVPAIIGVVVAIFAVVRTITINKNRKEGEEIKLKQEVNFSIGFAIDLKDLKSKLTVASTGRYKKLAKNNNYTYKQGTPKNKKSSVGVSNGSVGVHISLDKYIKNYADFKLFPYNAGVNRRVRDIIEGEYKGYQFCVFNYSYEELRTHFTEVYATYGIEVAEEKVKFTDEQENIFYKNGKLYLFEDGYADAEGIHDHLDRLIDLCK